MEQGVDDAAVLGSFNAMDAGSRRRTPQPHGAAPRMRGGGGVVDAYAPERARLVYSLSKSFTSTALAIAVSEGLVGLEDTASPTSRRSPVNHRCAEPVDHASRPGCDGCWSRPRHVARSAGPRAGGAGPRFLAAGACASPGSVFAYSQPCTYTLAAIIQRRTGMRLSDYLRPRLLDPLGIGDLSGSAGLRVASWVTDSSPRPRTWPGLGSCTYRAAAGATASWCRRATSRRRRLDKCPPRRWRTSTGDRVMATSSRFSPRLPGRRRVRPTVAWSCPS